MHTANLLLQNNTLCGLHHTFPHLMKGTRRWGLSDGAKENGHEVGAVKTIIMISFHELFEVTFG